MIDRSERLFPPVAERVKPGKAGAAEVTHFTLTDADVSRAKVRALVGGDPDIPAPGDYVRLTIDEGDGPVLYMTDTPMEHETNRELLKRAHGHVLIAGLGIGMVIPPLLAKPRVHSLTILEKYQEVIDLVMPSLEDLPGREKLTVECADVFTWEPSDGRRYDCIYYDIWPQRVQANLREMDFLHSCRAPLYANNRNGKLPGNARRHVREQPVSGNP